MSLRSCYLIVKTSSLGDIIQTLPVAQYLRSREPTCNIDWVVEEEYAPLLRAYDAITRVIPVRTRAWKRSLFKSRFEIFSCLSHLRTTHYDALFDLQGNVKSALITGCAKSHHKIGFGWRSVPEKPNLLVTDSRFNVDPLVPIQHRYLMVVQGWFHDPTVWTPRNIHLHLSPEDEIQLATVPRHPGLKVMVAFGSRWKNKTPSLPVWKELLSRLSLPIERRFYVMSGTPEERAMAEELVVAYPGSVIVPALSIPAWHRLMSEMSLVVTVDSAALALCGTTATPSWSLFGPTLASVYKPIGAHHQHVQAPCPYGTFSGARCPQLRTCPTGACLRGSSITSCVLPRGPLATEGR